MVGIRLGWLVWLVWVDTDADGVSGAVVSAGRRVGYGQPSAYSAGIDGGVDIAWVGCENHNDVTPVLDGRNGVGPGQEFEFVSDDIAVIVHEPYFEPH